MIFSARYAILVETEPGAAALRQESFAGECMEFNSFQYIFFLGALFAVYYFLPQVLRKCLLVAASLAFYMFWNVKYTLLMLVAIVITYTGALLMERFGRWKKWIAGAALAAVLFILLYFKYANFIIETFNSLFGQRFELLQILLPVGVSFYTFQSMGYVIDVYRGKIEAQKNLLDYTLFISFFPQLVAGPIERSTNLLPQIRIKQSFRLPDIKDGVTLILIGLVKKVVISQRMAILVDVVFNEYVSLNSLWLAAAAVCFSIQIYTDFAAYTDIARGSAKLFGYELMENFRAPYLAENIKDFWRRWHISLSSWFTEYLYFPLGGSRVSRCRHLFNVAVVFLTSGLWHGASYTFLMWGALHAAAQIFFILKPAAKKSRRRLNILLTYSFVCFTYIFFRASSMGQAAAFVRCLFTNAALPLAGSLQQLSLLWPDIVLTAAIVIWVFVQDHALLYRGPLLQRINAAPVWRQALIYAGWFLALTVLGVYGVHFEEKPFIYFQF